jgi:hypothetical protein
VINDACVVAYAAHVSVVDPTRISVSDVLLAQAMGARLS